jgi:hypothetical protein
MDIKCDRYKFLIMNFSEQDLSNNKIVVFNLKKQGSFLVILYTDPDQNFMLTILNG